MGTELLLRIASLSAVMAQLGRWHPEYPNMKVQREKLRKELAELPDVDLTPL